MTPDELRKLAYTINAGAILDAADAWEKQVKALEGREPKFWRSLYYEVLANYEALRQRLEAAERAIDTSTWFYKNCKRQRKNAAKICQVCPFRKSIEAQEAALAGEE